MLKEIRCDKFIKSPIEFHQGLNVVLGDDLSTNSIGKSMFLMILDFVFGGSSYIKSDSGAEKNIGPQIFHFEFVFNKTSYYYSRSTENPIVISICDKSYNALSEIDGKEYTNRLKDLYKIENQLSFRLTVNPFSRIWSKDNYNVNFPLLNSGKENGQVQVNNLIKLFNKFDTIVHLVDTIKIEEESKKAISNAEKKELIPKITKTEFLQNESKITEINDAISDIKENLIKFTVNIEQLTSKEIIELKTQKSKLFKGQSIIENKIGRIDLNLENKSVKSKYFNRLSDFFQAPNEKKIMEIESFHNNIAKILQTELLAAKEILQTERENYISIIQEIDVKIAFLLGDVNSPKYIVDKVYDLTINANKLKSANKFYQDKQVVIESIKELTESLNSIIDQTLSDIQVQINEELIRINKEIHTAKKKVPMLKLNRKSYSFDHSGNAGTGKSFADLIEFDLTILKLTDLPFLIHDSVLFKNIEDMSIDKITEQYSSFQKQIFIALDGINRFDSKTQNLLEKFSVLKLSNTQQLFNKDWR